MFAIYKRELKSYFHSFIGLLFIAVTIFFVSIYFVSVNLLNGSPYLSHTIVNTIFIFLIAVPILSMRILAEEKKSKTDQLILTAPVSVAGIVLGKYLALLTIFLIPTAVVGIYPLILSFFGSIPMASAYLSLLAFFLYGAAAIAVGVFISSLTESQVISAVITFIVLFAGYMMPSICQLISDTGNAFTKILGCYDMVTPFTGLLNGTLNLKSVLYFVLLIILALFLTVQAIQKRRYTVSVKNLSFGAYSSGAIVLVVAAIMVINLVVGELPSSWTNIDVTQTKLYSLTEQSKKFIETIDEDVTIYVYSAEDSQDPVLGQTLKRFAGASDHIKVEYIDPVTNPTFYMQYTSSISNNSLIVVSDKRHTVIDFDSVYEKTYDYDYFSANGYTSRVTGYDGEGQITNALDFVLNDEMPKIYMTDGHGEIEFGTSFASAIEKENVTTETINLINYDKVPDDAQCLIINVPNSDFSSDDKDKVIDYLKTGGNVLFVTGFFQNSTYPNLAAILDYMGLYMTDGLVLEQNKDNYYTNPYYLLPNMIGSVYTTGLYKQRYVFAPYSQGIKLNKEKDESISFNSFLNTTNSSFCKVDGINTENYQKSEKDEDGPFSIGVESERQLDDEHTATLLAFSCSMIFTDDANSIVSGGNMMLFSNVISQMVMHDVSVSIPVKSYGVSALLVPKSRAMMLGVVTVVIIPLTCLAAGFVIWFRRRKR
ncbi:MAG: Gldg family protein [Acetatifactor sp.]